VKIVIGKSGGHNVSIDLNVLLTTRALLTADSGGGKTFALKRICEQAKGKIQILIIDPEGEFAPMREKLDFVLVGKGGETPADVRSAALVAQTLLKLRADAICDIYEMKPSERHGWVRTFIEALIEAPKETRHPCLVIVDEAHMFCPEHGKGESEAGDAMISLCTRGRKRLLCPLFATQRLATLSKDASSMLLNRMIGPTFEDINRKRAADVLGITKEDQKEFYKEIQTLEPGNFFCLGRAISKERILCHIGPIDTPHGQEALRYEMKPPPAPDAIKALLPKLADLPKQAEEQAKTVAEFKTEIRSLKAQLRAQPSGKPVEVKVADQKLIDRAVASTMHAFRGQMGELQRAIERQRRVLDAVAKMAAKEVGIELPKLAKLETPKVTAPFVPKPVSTPVRAVRAEADGDAPKLKAGAVNMLQILAQWHPDPRTRDQLGVLAGFAPGGGTFSEYLSVLRRAGYISENGNGVHITDEGLANVGSIQPRPESPAELAALWKSKFKAGVGKMLDALVNAYPAAMTREDLGEATGFTSSGGTFSEYLSQLRRAKLIEEGGGSVRAAASLMEI